MRENMRWTGRGVALVFWAMVTLAALPSFCLAKNLSGTVVETMNSGGYTYVLLGTADKKVWIAVPEMAIRVGDQAEFTPGVEMGEYTSPTLGRTFESITFSSGAVAVVPGQKQQSAEAAAETPTVKVAKAQGQDAYVIEEMFARKAELAGRTVSVRGQVVKVSKFSGATWLRIVDGTGSKKKGDHKLVVITSQDDLAKDAVVTVRGVLRTDRKIGALDFDVVIEDATVTPEKSP